MILELAGARALDRPMAGIVNARGHFVEHRPVLRREELKRQPAHIIERLGDRAGKLARFGGLRADQRPGGPGAAIQNARLVLTVGRVPDHHLPVDASGEENGTLPLYADEAFKHAGLTPWRGPGAGRLSARPHDPP